jgi:hypothetical protein
MNVLVTPSEVMENQPMLDLIWRTRFRWRLWPRQVTGDTTYGTIDNIKALEHEHIHAYVPLPDAGPTDAVVRRARVPVRSRTG